MLIPDGEPDIRTYEQCIAAVNARGAWRATQCRKLRGHGPNGEFCKQHAKKLIKMTNAEAEMFSVMRQDTPPTPRCKHGHLWTEKNTRWYPARKNGKKYRACRKCEADRYRIKYQTNPEHRKRILANGRAWRAARKKERENARHRT